MLCIFSSLHGLFCTDFSPGMFINHRQIARDCERDLSVFWAPRESPGGTASAVQEFGKGMALAMPIRGGDRSRPARAARSGELKRAFLIFVTERHLLLGSSPHENVPAGPYEE